MTSPIAHPHTGNATNLLEDGDFTEASDGAAIVGVNNGVALEGQNAAMQKAYWLAYCSPNMAVGVFENTYDPQQFHSTSDGKPFCVLSCDPHSEVHNPNSAIGQAIKNIPAGSYTLTWNESDSAIAPQGGSVTVELVPTLGGAPIYSQSFQVAAGSGWNSLSTTIPVTAAQAGPCTLVFIADNQNAVGIISDVVLVGPQ